ncbi:MAG TPA: fumarylacetoacetase, partial [Phycisphaerales bacterium]|nr:fumarylacetoacetase [Phycisphaerales bacterium]
MPRCCRKTTSADSRILLSMNHTHDPKVKSWIESANDPASDFPIQNLPFGVFRSAGTNQPGRIGIAIGDRILDVRECVKNNLLKGISQATADSLSADALNQFMSLGHDSWHTARIAMFQLLESNADNQLRAAARKFLLPMSDAEMLLPAKIGDYTDFYASVHHATNVGKMFRPDQAPLLPNWKHLPVGYHGRASSIVMSGTPVRRPMGQTKADTEALPTFGACKLLDYEMELGWFIGKGSQLGTRLSMNNLQDQIFGMVIVNDWSARDIQKWEYVPLGPFNAKNFATTISPWITTLEALEPYRITGMPRSSDDPPMLPYLSPSNPSAQQWGLNIQVEVWLRSAEMRKRNQSAVLVSRSGFSDMYWTIAQMTVHHTSTGCNLRSGDMLASGTISGASEESRGCLLERTWRGENPLTLPDGTQRKFLQDGDEV